MKTEKLNSMSVYPEMNIKQALKRMDESGEKTLFVIDEKRRLIGTVTDGDIRKWIIKRTSLAKKISKVMNPKPSFLREGYSEEDAKKMMVSKVIECIPVVDDQMRIISSVRWLDIFDGAAKRHKAIKAPVIIMAGGEGTRLSPFTNILPKPLMPVGERPIIELIMDRFNEFGCKEFYLSLNYKSNIISAYFSEHRYGSNISYIYEEKPLGTAGSLRLIKNKVKTTFFVTNCDIIVKADYRDIYNFHKDRENVLTLIVSLKHYTVPYGICEIEQGGVLKCIKEKPEYDFLVNTGFYIMEPEALGMIPNNSSYSMTDLIDDCIRKGKKIGVYPVSDKSWLDMGQFEALQDMLKNFKA